MFNSVIDFEFNNTQDRCQPAFVAFTIPINWDA